MTSTNMTANPTGRTLNKSFTWFWIGLCCSAGPVTTRAVWFFSSQFSARISVGVEDQLKIFTAHGLFSWTTSKNITAIASWRTLNTLNKSFTWFWSHPCPVNTLGLQFLYKSIFDLRVRCLVFYILNSFQDSARAPTPPCDCKPIRKDPQQVFDKCLAWFWSGLCCSGDPVTKRAVGFFSYPFSARISVGVKLRFSLFMGSSLA